MIDRDRSGADVYLFSATCEMAVGNGTNSYMAPKYLRKFEDDLSILPIYFAQEHDVVLLNRVPSEEYLKRIESFVNNDVRFLSLSSLESQVLQGELLIHHLKPWGWSQVIHRQFEKLKSSCSHSFKLFPNYKWDDSHRELYSRKMALDVLTRFLDHTSLKSKYISNDQIPRVVYHVEDVEHAISEYRQVVVKTPWSSSGRGMIFLNPNTFHKTYTDWVRGAIQSQGYVMLEHGFEKVIDLSFHFHVSKAEIQYLGQASFTTAENGQYIGNNIQILPKDLELDVQAFLTDELFKDISTTLQMAIANSDISESYHGVLGVDVLVYRDEDGALKVQPCLEINLRYNMGTLALKIREFVHSKAQGVWKVEYLESGDSLAFDHRMQTQYPVVFDDGKLLRGYIPLIEPDDKKCFALYLLAE